MRLNLIPRLPELVRELGSTVTTDIPLEAALNLGRLLSAIPPDQIVGKAVEGDLVSSATTPGGAAVLLLNKAKASALGRGRGAPPPRAGPPPGGAPPPRKPSPTCRRTASSR